MPNNEPAPSGAGFFIHACLVGRLPAVTLLELLATAAGARVVAPDILQGVAYRRLRAMLAIRTVDMVMMIVVVAAVRAVNVGLVHVIFSRWS